ncbi:MAG: 23S rRNA (adenine(2030)-N(6))-methyltransferase RlmJ [Alphaproteobacteria bacterium]
MNYRHVYHAGSFSDVFKHVVLLHLIEHLLQKDKPVFLLDTHAGSGRADLAGEAAMKTGEGAAGIGRLWDADLPPGLLQRYRTLIARFNPDGLRFYPGSPLILQAMLRPGDRLVANELHPEDAASLAANLGRDRQVRVEQDDGYRLLKALLPPPERRGLALVDPPFEQRDEFDLMTRGLRDAHQRWATGIYAMWYPIKDVAAIAAWHRALAALGIARIAAVELLLWPPVNPERLNGCGLVVVNPPWTLAAALEAAMPTLIEVLTRRLGSYRLSEIAGESD